MQTDAKKIARGDLGGRPVTGEKIVAALTKAGVEFLAEDDGGPGVRLRKERGAPKPKKGTSERDGA